MAFGGPHGGMIPAGPKLGTEEFRHEMEWPATLATLGIIIGLLIFLGALTNVLVALIVPVVMTVFGVWLSNASHKGHMVQVGPNQFPHLHHMAVNIAQRLDMPLPHIYVTQSPIMNAFASGLTLPGNVVFHSALLEAMSEEEIATVMAHEFGHIKCRHVVYMILQQLFMGVQLPIPLIGDALRMLFFFSSRTKEYSADRAALLGTMDIQACVTSEIKLAVGPKLYEQMNIRAYLQQITDFNNQASSKFIELLSNRTHPLTINRIQAILRFYRSEKYQQLAHRWGKAGTTTLTSGNVGTTDLFSRVAAKADWEKQLKAAGGAPAAANAPVAPSFPANAPAAGFPTNAPAPGYPANAQAAQPFPVQQQQFAPQGPIGNLSGGPVGATPASVTCSTCGLPMALHARFCPHCGAGVAGAAIQQPAAPAPEVAPAERPVVQVVRRATRAAGDAATPSAPLAQSANATPAAPAAQPVAAAPAVAPVAPVAPPAATACASCGTELAPGAKFCGGCGAPVAPR